MTTIEKDDIIGQYASDHLLHGGKSDLSRDSAATKDIRGNGDLGFHQENVFGQNEPDPDELENLLGYGEGLVALSDTEVEFIDDEDDEAARWLRDRE